VDDPMNLLGVMPAKEGREVKRKKSKVKKKKE
jgi:hypothetical protein